MTAAKPVRKTSARGQHRRQQLVDAAGALLVEQGFGALSHRAVAARAGVPLAATTYYFTSLDDLLAQAVTDVADQWLSAARDVVEQLPRVINTREAAASALIRIATSAPGNDRSSDPTAQLTMYERYVEAARHPQVKDVITRYDESIDGLIGDILLRAGLPHSPETARLVLAVIDGTTLRALAEGAPPSAATHTVEHLLAVLATSSGRPD